MNNKFQQLQNQLEIILKKVKYDNTKEFNSIIQIQYNKEILLTHSIRERLKQFGVDVIKIDTQKQMIFLY